MRSCIHFRGAQTTCGAGVDVETRRDGELRLACVEVRGASGATPCELRAWPPGPAPGEPGRMMKRLERIFAGKCPTCDEPLTGERHVGTRVYSKPCNHLLSEGS